MIIETTYHPCDFDSEACVGWVGWVALLGMWLCDIHRVDPSLTDMVEA